MSSRPPKEISQLLTKLWEDKYGDDSNKVKFVDKVLPYYLEQALADQKLADHMSNFMSVRLAAHAHYSNGHPNAFTPHSWRALVLEMSVAFARLPDMVSLPGHEKVKALEQFKPFIQYFCHLWD
jgi:hypothetical protein